MTSEGHGLFSFIWLFFKLFKLFVDYFNRRKQKIKLNDIFSNSAPISLGVPQGSILGPLLFIIFINYLPQNLSNVMSKLFADYTTLIAADEDLGKLESKLMTSGVNITGCISIGTRRLLCTLQINVLNCQVN